MKRKRKQKNQLKRNKKSIWPLNKVLLKKIQLITELNGKILTTPLLFQDGEPIQLTTKNIGLLEIHMVQTGVITETSWFKEEQTISASKAKPPHTHLFCAEKMASNVDFNKNKKQYLRILKLSNLYFIFYSFFWKN